MAHELLFICRRHPLTTGHMRCAPDNMTLVAEGELEAVWVIEAA